MGYVIGQCPFLGDENFCSRNGRNCKDASCLLHDIVKDCIKFKGSNALQEILFRTMDICEVRNA